MERGHDKTRYTVLADILKKNGYLCVNPVLLLLTTNDLVEMASRDGVEITHGLASSMLFYAGEDVGKM